MPHETVLDGSGPPYRKSAGICLFNRQGLVLVAERCDMPGAWQMPQGGIQVGEDPDIAVLREMKEEIGTDNARLIDKMPELLRYDFPDYLHCGRAVFNGKYKGQEQLWYALLFLGADSEIVLDASIDPEPPEFKAWRWVALEETPALIVPFKRAVYEKVVARFAPLAEKIRQGSLSSYSASRIK